MHSNMINSSIKAKTFNEMYANIKLNGYGGFGFSSFETDMHMHPDFYEITYITSGVYTHIHDSQTDIVTSGTLLFLSPHSIHQLHTEPMQATFFAICVHKDYFRNYLKQHFPSQAGNVMPNFVQMHLDTTDFTYLEQLGHQLSVPHPSSYVADTILYIVLTNLFYKKTQSQSSKAHYVQYILNILNEPNNLKLSAKEIYNTVDISVPVLTRKFKEQTGYSITEYKAKKKMEFAADMLKNSDKKIIDIAFELHYESLSYFLRCFKKEFGMTPSEYRKTFC